MTGEAKLGIARRPLLTGFMGLIGLIAFGGAIYELPKLARARYAATPYDDILAQLDDRESAEKFGRAVIAAHPDFQVDKEAAHLRHEMDGRTLHSAIEDDLARGGLMEVHGWLVPETLAIASGIAAKVAARAP